MLGLVVLLTASSILPPKPPELIVKPCTTNVSIVIWNEAADENNLFRITVPIECSIAQKIITNHDVQAPILFEQQTVRKDWRATVTMKDFVGAVIGGEPGREP